MLTVKYKVRLLNLVLASYLQLFLVRSSKVILRKRPISISEFQGNQTLLFHVIAN